MRALVVLDMRVVVVVFVGKEFVDAFYRYESTNGIHLLKVMSPLY